MPNAEDPNRPVHVSITALRPGGPLRRPLFLWYTLRAARAARVAPGNLSVDMRRIGDAYHTLTVWRDRSAMLAFVRSDAHREAVRGYPWVGMGRVAGFAAASAPDWSEVPGLLLRHGKTV